MADVKKAKQNGTDKAVKMAMLIFFDTMHHKHGWGAKRLKALQAETNALAEDIVADLITLDDLNKNMKDLGLEFLHFDGKIK